MSFTLTPINKLQDRKSFAQSRRTRRFRCQVRNAIAALSILAGSLFVNQTASAAKIPRVLRPGTRPMAFNFGLGGAFGIGNSYRGHDGYWGPAPGRGRYAYGGYYSTFKLTQEFIYHFSGSAKGPALGVLFQQEFPVDPNFGLTLAPKFVWDIQIVKNLGFYISPDISLGYHGYFGPGSTHAADLQFGVSGKLILNDRWVVWLQTPHFELQFYRGGGVFARYELMTGGGVTF